MWNRQFDYTGKNHPSMPKRHKSGGNGLSILFLIVAIGIILLFQSSDNGKQECIGGTLVTVMREPYSTNYIPVIDPNTQKLIPCSVK